jgi:DNA-binding NtrC family response regulator
VEPLVRFFVHQMNQKLNRSLTGVDPACLEALRAAPWPGNIRQLENVLERAILMADGPVLKVFDLPEELSALGRPLTDKDLEGESHQGGFKEIVRRQTQSVERELIEKALEETGGNVTRAAEKLGLSRKGLQLKLKELGLKR